MAVVVLDVAEVLVTFADEFVVVHVAGVAGDAEVTPQVDGFCHLLAGDERLVELLAVARPYYLDFGFAVARVHLSVDLLEGGGEGGEGSGGCLLHKQVAIAPMLKGIHHQVHRVVEGHHEAGHVGVGDGNLLATHYLVLPEGDYRSARCHHIAVAGAADGGFGIVAEFATFGDCHLLHQRLRDTHGVDGVCRLVGGEDNDVFDTMFDGGQQYIVGTYHIGAGRLHGEELTTGNLLEGSRRKYIVDTAHGDVHRFLVADVANKVLHFFALKFMAHIVLFLLIARKYAYFLNIRIEKAVEDRISETSGATGYEQHLILEYRHFILYQ